MGLGRVIEGNVLDMDKKHIARLLRNYDKLLYLKWNPDKRKGKGCWEVRRRPEFRMPKLKTLVGEVGYWEMEYQENNMINHVMDADILDLRIMHRLYEMDTFRVQGNWTAEMEYRAAKWEEAQEAKKADDIKHMIKDNKKYYSQLKELVQQGYNPAWFFSQK